MNPEEIQKIKELQKKYGLSGGNFDTPQSEEDKTLSIVKSRREMMTGNKGAIADIKGIGTGIKEDLSKRSENIKEISQTEGAGKQGVLRSLFQKAGQVAGGVSDVIGQTVMGGIKALTPQPIQEAVAKTVQAGAEKVMESDTAQKLVSWYSGLDEQKKKDIGAVAGIVSLATDITGAGLAKKPVTQTVKTAVDVGTDILKATPKATNKLATVVKETINKPVTAEKAIGEVLQGKAMSSKQVKGAIETIKQIDTTGIKTYADLDKKLSEKIPELAKKVDDDLGQDLTKIPLNDLKVVKQSKGGQTVEIPFVEDALNQLDELYNKTGDLVEQQNIKELINLAKTEGLTRLEVNDIARTYGQEFGEKAFNKIGEPLTSINSQMFENTRKGLKEIARSGIKGVDAKKADELMSRIYNIKNLTKKNIERVNALMNRIEERGLVEKIGNAVSKYADILSGGSLRGFVGGLLPRGAGYKVLNAIDLETLLERNLKVIQEASKSKTTKQFNEVIKKLNFDLKSIGKNSGKAVIGGTLLGGDE